MVVRLRLQRFGKIHKPFYRMVAADARAPRDGRFLEVVSIHFQQDRMDGWMDGCICILFFHVICKLGGKVMMESI